MRRRRRKKISVTEAAAITQTVRPERGMVELRLYDAVLRPFATRPQTPHGLPLSPRYGIWKQEHYPGHR
jgi:hypothetical protein